MSQNRYLKKLTLWVKEGLITPYQLEEIVAFESQNNQQDIKWVRKTGWQLLAVFLVCMGLMLLVIGHWSGWSLWIRLLSIFAGAAGLQWCAYSLFQAGKKTKILGWIHYFSSSTNRDETPALSTRYTIASLLYWTAYASGLALVSQQYPVTPALHSYLSWVIWLSLPVMFLLKSQVGMLLLGLLALMGIGTAPPTLWVWLQFPMWLLGILWLIAPIQHGKRLGVAFSLIWMANILYSSAVSTQSVWVFPIIGALFFLLPHTKKFGFPAQTSAISQGIGLIMMLTWGLFSLFIPFAVSPYTGFLPLLLVSGLYLERRQPREGTLFFLPNTTCLFLFLFWTLLLTGLHAWFPALQATWRLCHAGIILALGLSFAWDSKKPYRLSGYSLILFSIGTLFFDPMIPTWMRALLLLGSGVGIWAFVRKYGFSPPPTESDVTTPSIHWQENKWPSAQTIGLTTILILGAQWIAMLSPVVFYEWIRATGTPIVWKAVPRDPYDPFRGHYMQVILPDFERDWPIESDISDDTDHAYLSFSTHKKIDKPDQIHPNPPKKPYLKVPIFRGEKSMVTQSPLSRVYMSEKQIANIQEHAREISQKNRTLSIPTDAPLSLLLHVKLRHGRYVLDTFTLEESPRD